MSSKNKVYFFGGGTVAHIASHLALSAPAYGTTARRLAYICDENKYFQGWHHHIYLTKMADRNSHLETNEDVAREIEFLKTDKNTKAIFFNCALVDYKPNYTCAYNALMDEDTGWDGFVGKLESRLETRKHPNISIHCSAADKIIGNIKKGRPDIFVVGFKTTCGAEKDEMLDKSMNLIDEAGVDLVLANDVKTRWNMVVTSRGEDKYLQDRETALVRLACIANAHC